MRLARLLVFGIRGQLLSCHLCIRGSVLVFLSYDPQIHTKIPRNEVLSPEMRDTTGNRLGIQRIARIAGLTPKGFYSCPTWRTNTQSYGSAMLMRGKSLTCRRVIFPDVSGLSPQKQVGDLLMEIKRFGCDMNARIRWIEDFMTNRPPAPSAVRISVCSPPNPQSHPPTGAQASSLAMSAQRELKKGATGTVALQSARFQAAVANLILTMAQLFRDCYTLNRVRWHAHLARDSRLGRPCHGCA